MPTAVLPPGLDALLRAARAPSYEASYPMMEDISPEEMAIAGMPDVSDIMLKREALAGQRANFGGQHALGASELAEQSIARQIADALAQERMGHDWQSLASRHSLGTQGLGLKSQELEQTDRQNQIANAIEQMKVAIEGQRVRQTGDLGFGGLALKSQELQQSLMPDLLRAMAQYELGRGQGQAYGARASELMAGLPGGAMAQQQQPADSSGGLANFAIPAAILAAIFARKPIGRAFSKLTGRGAGEVAEAGTKVAAEAVPSQADEIAKALSPEAPPMSGTLEGGPGFVMGEGSTTTAPVWMRGPHQHPNPIEEALERVMGNRQSMGPRAPQGAGSHQFGPPAVIGGGPLALPDEAKQLLATKILEAATRGVQIDPHVARWLSQFSQ